MERKIGEIFEFDGEWYQCINTGNCSECAFTGKRCYDFSTKRIDIIGDCTERTFKKLEKVGKPYEFQKRTIQTYKLYTEPFISVDMMDFIWAYLDGSNIIDIIIKQNKEDMEEKKLKISFEKADYLINKLQDILADYLHGGESDEVIAKFEELLDMEEKHSNSEKIGKNLKEFNLEAVKAGKPVCTRDGRKARIICFDLNNDEYPIVAAITNNGKEDELYKYDINGINGTIGILDIMMLSEKKEGWVNVYYDNDASSHRGCRYIYDTKEQAIKEAGSNYITTIKINWEE